LPVGLAVEDEFVGGGLEPVDRGLREERVGHESEPLIWNWHRFVLVKRAW